VINRQTANLGWDNRSTNRLHGDRSPSPPPPQPHWQRLHGEHQPHVCLHDALSPLFARLPGIHDWLDDPVPYKKREETDRFNDCELAPEASARAWSEICLINEHIGSKLNLRCLPKLNAVMSSDSAATPRHRFGSYLHGSGK
jgi:hypothetical protein